MASPFELRSVDVIGWISIKMAQHDQVDLNKSDLAILGGPQPNHPSRIKRFSLRVSHISRRIQSIEHEITMKLSREMVQAKKEILSLMLLEYSERIGDMTLFAW